MVLQVNDLVLLEVNAEIAKLTICRLSGHFFHENFTGFDRVFSVSDENDTYNDRESYFLDPKLTLTCNSLCRKVPILYRIGKKTQPVARVGEKKNLAIDKTFLELSSKMIFDINLRKLPSQYGEVSVMETFNNFAVSTLNLKLHSTMFFHGIMSQKDVQMD